MIPAASLLRLAKWKNSNSFLFSTRLNRPNLLQRKNFSTEHTPETIENRFITEFDSLVKQHSLPNELMNMLESFKKEFSFLKNQAFESIKPKPTDVFVNSELSLEKIDIFGFDYDYTIATYTEELQKFIYTTALEFLVNHLKYPPELLTYCIYDPKFAIRGLHYEIKKGFHVKLDQNGRVQPDSVWYGKRRATTEEILQAYPLLAIQGHFEDKVRLLNDIYSFSETCLLADIIHFFAGRGNSFSPSLIWDDVYKARKYVHGGVVHREIMSNLPKYLSEHSKFPQLLLKLRDAGKKIFLLTNSQFHFVDCGMKYLCNKSLPSGVSDWRELFDVVMTSARKPRWYTEKQPFRLLDVEKKAVRLNEVNSLEKGEVYEEGSLSEFTRMAARKGNRVLYFGDHVFHDLREPNVIEGWKTGVIIRELEREVEIQTSNDYQARLVFLLELEKMIRHFGKFSAIHSGYMITLKHYRDLLKLDLKNMYNPNFGSVFRTYGTATVFSFLIQRYADVYTSKVENLLDYPLDYTFYPDRMFLQHEVKVY